MAGENLGNQQQTEPQGGEGGNEANEPAGANQQQTEPQGGEGGKPDAAKAAEKYRAQRDEERKRADALEEQIKNLKEKGDIDAVMKQLEEQKAAAEKAEKKAERDRVNSARLAQAGCVDLEVALDLLDENGDVDSLKKAKPYLFAKPKGSTGHKPDGSPSTTAKTIREALKQS